MNCLNCGKPQHAHIEGRCPKLQTLTIDAASIERVLRTGHPRTLLAVLARKEPREVFKEVQMMNPDTWQYLPEVQEYNDARIAEWAQEIVGEREKLNG